MSLSHDGVYDAMTHIYSQQRSIKTDQSLSDLHPSSSSATGNYQQQQQAGFTGFGCGGGGDRTQQTDHSLSPSGWNNPRGLSDSSSVFSGQPPVVEVLFVDLTFGGDGDEQAQCYDQRCCELAGSPRAGGRRSQTLGVGLPGEGERSVASCLRHRLLHAF